ncbi:MAG: STAS domain-containing protein [Anaerolineales bacterium]|nr:STAS domain-containing protein [Chloroflexota bacterium]MBL6981904.1 STAS domain-containing protein [Anaerolineales bacterium]
MDLTIIETKPIDGVAVLIVAGRLNVISAGELKDKLKALVADGVYQIVLELAGVTFIDSSGLSAIVLGLKSTRVHEGALKLVGLRPTTKKVFELTRLDRVFEFYENTDEAIGSF